MSAYYNKLYLAINIMQRLMDDPIEYAKNRVLYQEVIL